MSHPPLEIYAGIFIWTGKGPLKRKSEPMTARNEISSGGFIPWGHLSHSWYSERQELMVTKDILVFNSFSPTFIAILLKTAHPFAPKSPQGALPALVTVAGSAYCLFGPTAPVVACSLWSKVTASSSFSSFSEKWVWLQFISLLQLRVPYLENSSYFVTPKETQTPAWH